MAIRSRRFADKRDSFIKSSRPCRFSLLSPSFLFSISRHDDDSRGNLAARLGTEIGVDCRNLVPALLNLRPPIRIFFHGAECYTAKLTHLSRRDGEREREKRIARLCIPFQRAKIAYHWKKRLASLSPRAICSQHETAPRHVFFFFFFNLNYSRVNVNCDRVEGECIGRKRDPWNGSILIWAIATLQVPRLRLFQGISEFSMHNRTVVERERRYTQRSKKMANDWRGKRTQLETQLLWHILVENVAT